MEPFAQLAALGVVGLGLFLVCAIALLLYLMPGFCAFIRRSEHRWAILFLNVFLGWAVIPWWICLVWAFFDKPKDY